jgi:uncharacterized membrane-anchored protein YhcB (DUF1043 family)
MRFKTIWSYALLGLLAALIFGFIPIGFNLRIGNTQINISTPKR